MFAMVWRGPNNAYEALAGGRHNILFGAAWEEERYGAALEACGLSTDLCSMPGRDAAQVGKPGPTRHSASMCIMLILDCNGLGPAPHVDSHSTLLT